MGNDHDMTPHGMGWHINVGEWKQAQSKLTDWYFLDACQTIKAIFCDGHMININSTKTIFIKLIEMIFCDFLEKTNRAISICQWMVQNRRATMCATHSIATALNNSRARLKLKFWWGSRTNRAWMAIGSAGCWCEQCQAWRWPRRPISNVWETCMSITFTP